MSVEETFWNWFLQHEGELLDFEADVERIFELLAAEMQKVDANLTFEFGPKEAKREFVVSASGIKNSFPAVASLVGAAPDFAHWRITAFRPRRTVHGIVEFRGKRADPDKIQFSLLDNGRIAGIRLFIPGFQDGDADWRQIGYLLLDDVLGEYDVESRLGLIKMYSPDSCTEEKRPPIKELPSAFDLLVSRLEGHSGKPS
jgi:hypothetical protein